VGSRDGLEAVAKKKIPKLPLPGIEPRSFNTQPSHYTDLAILSFSELSERRILYFTVHIFSLHNKMCAWTTEHMERGFLCEKVEFLVSDRVDKGGAIYKAISTRPVRHCEL
jgi:hypothetical protein